MKLNIVKNILICLLVAATFIQVNALWLANGAVKPPWQSSGGGTSGTGAYLEQLTHPYRLAISADGAVFSLLYDSDSLTSRAITIVSAAVRANDFSEVNSVDTTRIYAQPAVLMEYAVSMPSDAFLSALGIRQAAFLSRVPSFDMIALLPATDSETAFVQFISTPDNLAYEYRITTNIQKQAINELIETSETLNQPLYYVSSLHDAAFEGVFRKNEFIPIIDSAYRYPNVIVSNPYAQNGEKLLNVIEKKVDVFFTVPGSKWTSNNQPFTYRDETTVVKYYATDVLEYTRYKTGDGTRTGFADNYAAALALLSIDNTIENNYYLSTATETDGKWSFAFDYTIGGFALTLSKRERARTGLDHILEVTVQNGVVTGYKRLIYNFTLSSDIYGYVNPPRQALLSMLSSGSADTGMDAFSLCYLVDEEPYLSLYWSMRIGDVTFTVN